jgi:hypothetical protein
VRWSTKSAADGLLVATAVPTSTLIDRVLVGAFRPLAIPAITVLRVG